VEEEFEKLKNSRIASGGYYVETLFPQNKRRGLWGNFVSPK